MEGKIAVVGIVASPRKGMHTDTFVSKALEGAKEKGATTQKIYLSDLKISPCLACREKPWPLPCILKDGMEEVYKALESCDGVIVGSPAWYGSISSYLKLAIDRSNCLNEMVKLPSGKVKFVSRLKKKKKGVFVWVADISRDPRPAMNAIKLWFNDINVELIKVLIITDSERGKGARERTFLLDEAYQSGALLVNKIKESFSTRNLP